ncbi:MAG: hypothetical protein R3B89_26370 [Polyangiaceae bacterium]
MDKTRLGSVALGGSVNLERSLQLGGRLGGHLVSGHVDGPGGLSRSKTPSASPSLTSSPPRAS